jgi:hypothetical protein
VSNEVESLAAVAHDHALSVRRVEPRRVARPRRPVRVQEIARVKEIAGELEPAHFDNFYTGPQTRMATGLANRVPTPRYAVSRYSGGAVSGDTRRFASAAQLWRLNACGLLRVIDWPDEPSEQPLDRTEAKEYLIAAAAEACGRRRKFAREPGVA